MQKLGNGHNNMLSLSSSGIFIYFGTTLSLSKKTECDPC